MSLTTAKWTIDEYHRMTAAGILDNRRVELLKGKLLRCHRKANPTHISAYFGLL